MTIESDVKCFVAGLAAGTMAAALFTSTSGSQIRKYLRDKAAEGAEYLSHQDEELATTAASLDLQPQMNR